MDKDKLPNKIRIRKPHDDKRKLFKAFRSCVGEQWCSVLEIDKNNFLDRVFGSAHFETISKNFLTRSMMRNGILIAEYKVKIEGYAVSRMIRFFHAYNNLLLFVPISTILTTFAGGY